MLIGYAKVGRSMPLTLEGCGTVGGDHECLSILIQLARNRPKDTFVLVGRNSGEDPTDVGLPTNVINPWTVWGPDLKWATKVSDLDNSVEGQLRLRDWHEQVTRPEFRALDGMIMWIGQLGSSNSPIPNREGDGGLTKPQMFSANYASFVLHGINAWRDARGPWEYEDIHLNADPRNVYKSRDLKWPMRHPCLSQYEGINFAKGTTRAKDILHERYGDDTPPSERWTGSPTYARKITDGLWSSRYAETYSRIEMNSLVPGTPTGDLVRYDETWDGRKHFGLFINEARAETRSGMDRLTAMKKYVLPLQPYWVHGNWSYESQKAMGRGIEPAPWDQYYPRLHSVRSTFTTPSSGSGWATTKPWEAFAAGTVCFFHPAYDAQNNILKDAPELKNYLRVGGPLQLAERVQEMNEDRDKWLAIVRLQRAHFERALHEAAPGVPRYLALIEARLNGMGQA